MLYHSLYVFDTVRTYYVMCEHLNAILLRALLCFQSSAFINSFLGNSYLARSSFSATVRCPKKSCFIDERARVSTEPTIFVEAARQQRENQPRFPQIFPKPDLIEFHTEGVACNDDGPKYELKSEADRYPWSEKITWDSLKVSVLVWCHWFQPCESLHRQRPGGILVADYITSVSNTWPPEVDDVTGEG